MNAAACRPLIAVDVGNHALKIGLFSSSDEADLSVPQRVVRMSHEISAARMAEVCPQAPCRWYVVRVHRAAEASLAQWVRTDRPDDTYRLLGPDSFHLTIDVRFPQRVGTDRLAAAVAVNLLRCPSQPAVIVDAGTAVTVDLVDEEGVFRGGAILPGPIAAAAALAGATDALPAITDIDLRSMPEALGKSTEEAIRSGVAWGCVGAAKLLVDRLARYASGRPAVFCTGGAGRALAEQLGQDARFDPHLVLRGVALTGRLRADAP